MKNIKLQLFLIFNIILASCSSDGNDNDNELHNGEYYISYEINDNKIEYTTSISAYNYDSPSIGLYGVGMSGAYSNNALLIYLYDTAKISTGNYTGELIPGKYVSGAIISHGTSSEGYTSAAPNISSVAYANVNVTEINETYIAGNFNAALVSNSDYNTVTHIIKNGKFKLKFLIQ
ncbi:hypothetical protein ACFSKN_08600 [Mariniflexile gromovii]|uniref:CHRD domain-containing protein n=1 Tax=Mariniflexile gromovii TaxID=362523 RepID=A0ABS4BVH9_9FLAO|nr:hypothetical protein [Mariniflexile gromovii]MBP0904090.1 hypothetical protein [Mariniflexile gromovii]